MNSIKIEILVILVILLLPSFSFAGSVTQEKSPQQAENKVEHANDLSVPEERGIQTEQLNSDVEKFDKSEQGKAGALIYRPTTKRGAPVDRVAGGTRGIENEQSPILCVLTPDHTGFTFQKQPSLYYFLSKSVQYPIELTIIEDKDDVIEPVLEVRIAAPEAPGIQFIHLTDFDIHLQTDVPYKWHVSIILDPGSRAKDTLAWGRIERVECPGKLQNTIHQTNKTKRTHIYAEAGIWYDAFSEISNLIDNDPHNPLWRKQRVSLLEQVELQQVAQFEMDKIDGF
jgi:Domain of Unknown Function (DUF928)